MLCFKNLYLEELYTEIVAREAFCNFHLFFPWYQLSFQEWTQQMKDMLDARKRGDYAFRDKDFKTAIDCYTQVYIASACSLST